KRREERQGTLLVAADRLPKSAGHPLYQRLNGPLAEAGFDAWVEGRCRQSYEMDEGRGRPSIAPGIYFRMPLGGHFGGSDGPRGTAGRGAERLGLRQFPGLAPDGPSPDHSTLTNTRKRLPPEAFGGVPIRAGDRGRDGAADGPDGGRGQHDAGGERGDEEH